MELDSLDAYILLVFTEEMAGLEVPLEDLPAIFTLGDAYAYYKLCWAASHREEDVAPGP